MSLFRAARTSFASYCIEHFSEIASVEDVEDLSENFGINPPEGFFIENLKKAKQTNLENDNDNGIIFDDEVFKRG